MSLKKFSAAVVILAFASALGACSVSAREQATSGQFHFRTGMVSGSYSATNVAGSFGVPTSLDFELELFSSARASWVARSIIAHDLSTALLRYAYAGFARRWYLSSTGMSFDSSDNVTSITTTPRWRYYAGADLGVASVIVKTFGTVLTQTSALIDYGGHLGAIYQVSKSTGIEAQFGYTMGLGFSSVSVGGTSTRMLFGLSIYL